MNFDIKHDSKNQKFFTLIGGKECSLKYDKVSDTIWDFKQLFVPRNMRGQGIASRLAEYALQHARKNFLRVKDSCSYVKYFINSRKEYEPLRVTKSDMLELSVE